MKIYTEVIYSWDDKRGELVQESSKSYDYEGPLTLANGSEQGVEYLQYPENLGNEVNNWVSFSAYEFKTGGLPTLDIALYIPGDGLQTSYKSDYESVGTGRMGNELARAVQGQSAGFSATAFTKQIESIIGGVKSEGGKVGMIEAGKLADKSLSGAKAIMEQEAGAVLNPYIIAAYKGPTDMRTHDFTFQMLPQSENESKNCLRIAQAFKTAMLPSHSGGQSSEAPSMLFGYPDEFEISYTINGEKLPKSEKNPMFNIGRSVLTQCDLDFATESVPLFFTDTQYPVSISMKLTFMEIEVMYRDKIYDKGL